MDTSQIKIDGEQIYLRGLTEADATAEYCSWLNDPDVNKYLETRSATIDGLKEYIRQQNDNPNSFFLAVIDKASDRHIGNVKLEPIKPEKQWAMFGILIGNKDFWGKGIGTEATQLITDYGFDELGLEEIELGLISDNKKALRAYEKVGFKVTDIKEKDINHDGELFDRITMVFKK